MFKILQLKYYKPVITCIMPHPPFGKEPVGILLSHEYFQDYLMSKS